jgi:hypothetical protein
MFKSRSSGNERNNVDALNMLRVMATFCVYMLHTVSASGMYLTLYYKLLDYKWVAVLNTPAWAGVWILFILGGYLAGKSFATGRYLYTPKDTGRYYLTRIKKTYIPTMVFIFVFCIFKNPSWLIDNPKVLPSMLLLTYNGSPGLSGQGHLWFVFPMMMLYIIVPFASFLMEKLSKKVPAFVFVILAGVVAAAGLIYRLIAAENELDWYKYVYTPAYGNIDLFLSGLIFSFFTRNRKEGNKKIRLATKIIAGISVVAMLEINCFVALLGKNYIYKYIFPTIYVVICLFYFFAFDYKREKKNALPTLSNIRKNPLRIIDWFSGISLYFYIFHALVYNQYKMIMVEKDFLHLFLYLLFVLVMSTVLGYGFSRIFRYKKKTVPEKVKTTEIDEKDEEIIKNNL